MTIDKQVFMTDGKLRLRLSNRNYYQQNIEEMAYSNSSQNIPLLFPIDELNSDFANYEIIVL